MRLKLRTSALVMMAAAMVALAAAGQSQILTAERISADEFDRLFMQVSNWGRWGKGDQRGALNLITDDKRRQAAALVRNGISVSMQYAPLDTAAPERGDPFYSHMEALCHLNYKRRMYNGFVQPDAANPPCRTTLGLENVKTGIFTRGVLIDMPAMKGVQWLEPGTPVTRQDLEDWEQKTGIKVLPGDAVFLRTGRWARRPKPGTVTGFTQHLLPEAGYHWSVVPWFKSHDAAVLGSDTSLDVRPGPVPEDVTIYDTPVRALALVAMGVHVVDGQNLEGVAELANKLRRWEFLVTAAPITITGGTGFPINVIATF